MFFIITLILLITNIRAQSTDECGKSLGCFTFPNGCKNTECKFVYKWTSKPDNTSHQFLISARVQDDIPISSAWLAIGFSTDQSMGNDDVVICKNSPVEKSVQHYHNMGQFTPNILEPRNPTLGLSDSKIFVNQGYLVCGFTRLKSMSNFEQYFDLNKNFFLLAAYGQVSPSGELIQHVFKLSSTNPINFMTQNLAESSSDSGVKVKTHASFMIIAWIVFASTGMIIARYFRFLFPNRKMFNLKIWFVIHRPVMLSTFILSLIGLFVILADKNWTWIDKSRLTEFVHSIFGILTIALAFIQILMPFFRPSVLHEKRFIFNYFHLITGTLILLLSIITLFIGTGIQRLNIGAQGIGIMVGWCVWIISFISIVEIVENKYKVDYPTVIMSQIHVNNLNENNENKIIHNELQIKLENIKLILLILHVLIAIGLSIGLIYLISTSNVS